LKDLTSNIKFWLPALLYAGLIFWLSSRPSPEAIRWIPIIAKLKLVHIIEYGILYGLLWYAITRTTSLNKIEVFALALTLTVLYGLTDEFHQIFVCGRTCRFADVAADGVGGMIVEACIFLKATLAK
jgi:VanZ family protein